jgi:heterodisulfide reductase subunit C
VDRVIDRRIINGSKFDPSLADEMVKAGHDRIRACIQCGTCTGSCPSGRRTAYRTRQIIRKALLGLREEILSDPNLWLCTTCGTCTERCPRKIDVTDAIMFLRNLAVKEGHMRPEHKALSHKLIETGHAVPIDDPKWSQLRQSLGLPPLPPTVHSSPKAVREVQEICKKTGFDKLVGYKADEKGEGT